MYIFLRLSYPLQFHYNTSGFFVAFSLSMLINCERPYIFSVFPYFTNELNAQCDYSSIVYRQIFSVDCLCTSCFLCLWQEQESHYHTAPSVTIAGCSKFLHSRNRRKGPRMSLETLNLTVFLFLFFLIKEISRIQLQLDRLIIPRLGKSITRKWVCSTFLFYTFN